MVDGMNQYSPLKGKSGFKRIFNATHYSISGFKAAFAHEAAFRQVLLINLILIPTSFFCDVSRSEQALMVAVCLLAIIVELFIGSPGSAPAPWKQPLRKYLQDPLFPVSGNRGS